MSSHVGAKGKADANHAGAEDDGEERAKRHRKPRERHKDGQEAKKDEDAGARHEDSISGQNNGNKFSSYRVGVRGEVCEEFCGGARNDFLVNLGKFARNGDARYSL